MKKRRILSLLVASMISVTAFVGCGSSSKDSAKKGSSSAQELNTILFDALTFDVNACYDADSTTVLGAVQEGLVRVKNDGEKDSIEMAGAESYKVSDDGLVYTFKLRKNKWSDGKEVTAQQYVDSVQRLLDPAGAFPYAFFAYDIKNGEAYNTGNGSKEDIGIKAVDDYTLEITLDHPVPYFLSKLSYTVFKPIRLDVIESCGDNYASDFKNQVYSGPFKIESWESGNSIVLVKNDSYWDADNVSLDKINMKQIAEFATQAQLFESGQLDVTGATQEYIDKWTNEAKEGKFQAITGDTPSLQYMLFNEKDGGMSGIMSNAKVRKAIGLSLDRDVLTKELYGRYTPAYGIVPSIIACGDELYRDKVEEPLKADAETYVNNSDKLKELFHEGLKELGKDTDDLSSITIEYLSYGDSELNKQRQEWWKQQIENNLGIKVNVRVEGEYKLYSAAKKGGEFDITMTGWTADYNDPMTFLDIWVTDGGNNEAGYADPEYDALIDSLKNETDNAKRLETYEKLENKLIKDDAVVAPLFYQDVRSFVQNKVKGFQMPAFGPTYEFKWVSIEE